MASALESLKLSLKYGQSDRSDLLEPSGNERTTAPAQNTPAGSITSAQPPAPSLTTPVHPVGAVTKAHRGSVVTGAGSKDSGDRSRTNTMTSGRLNIGAPVRFNPADLLDVSDSSDDDTSRKKDVEEKCVVERKSSVTQSITGTKSERKAISVPDTPSIQKLDPWLTPTHSLLKKPLPSSSESGCATRSLTGLVERTTVKEQCSVAKANCAHHYPVRPDEHYMRPHGVAKTAGETSNSSETSTIASTTSKVHVSPRELSFSTLRKPQTFASVSGLASSKLQITQSVISAKPSVTSHHQPNHSAVQPYTKPSSTATSDHLKYSSASSRESQVVPPHLPIQPKLSNEKIAIRSQNDSQAAPPFSHQITVKGRPYWVLAQLGKGACGKVYRAITANQHIVAIKHIDLRDFTELSSHEHEQLVESNLNEIHLLHLLQNSPHIIKLFSWELQPSRQELYLVMECGDGDLASYLAGLRKRQQEHGQREPVPRLVESWHEMLLAVNAIHEQRVVHSDLKPANFVFVRGSLKLIDFGIASKLSLDVTSIARETQIGTPNYMAPEMINVKNYHSNCKVNPKSDVWSLGCILYLMVYGKTPFQHITNQISKFQAIIDNDFKIPFPPLEDAELLNILKLCLTRDLECRPSVKDLLSHPFTRRIQWMKAPLSENAIQQLLVGEINNLTPASRSQVMKLAFPAEQAKGGDSGKFSGWKAACPPATARAPLQERTNNSSFQQLMASIAPVPAVAAAAPGSSKSQQVHSTYR